MNNVDELFKAIENGRAGRNIGYSTGLSKLDEYIGGIQKGIYYLIFGGSGSGKTSLALYSYVYRLLKDNPDKDINILYYSCEMSANVLLAKLLCLYVYEVYNVVISYTELMSWKEPLDDARYEYVVEGREWLNSISSRLIIYDKTLNRDTFYHQMMNLLEDNGEFIESEDGRRRVYTPYNPSKLILGIVDHIALCSPMNGATKKEEIDAISSRGVTLREKCGISLVILQQENRNAGSMDRRKADLQEPSDSDLKDSGNCYNDSDVCIGVYNPIKLKIKQPHGYPVIVEGQEPFIGLRDRYRALCLIKNRQGEPDKYISCGFYGELGKWRILPKPEEVSDWSSYLYLTSKEEEIKDETPRQESKQLIYNF